jgi:hypothetical protein
MFDNPCCRLVDSIGDYHNLCQASSDNIFFGIVAALGDDVRTQAFDQLVGRVLVEDHDLVNAGQRPQNLGPILLGIDWTIWALDPSDGCVRVQADDQPRAERF